MGFRTIVAGAGMLAALTLATTASASAQSAGAAASASGAHTRAAKPHHRAVKKQREAAKARHSKRARLSARHRRQPVAQADEGTVERSTAPVRETALPSRQQTAATRRFREFLRPQSFALAATQELRRPQLLAAHFSREIADPEIVGANWTAPVAAGAHEDRLPVVARDQTMSEESPSAVAAPVHNDPVQVQRAAPADKQPDRMSFLRWFFVAWGGVLTFASAVRLALG